MDLHFAEYPTDIRRQRRVYRAIVISAFPPLLLVDQQLVIEPFDEKTSAREKTLGLTIQPPPITIIGTSYLIPPQSHRFVDGQVHPESLSFEIAEPRGIRSSYSASRAASRVRTLTTDGTSSGDDGGEGKEGLYDDDEGRTRVSTEPYEPFDKPDQTQGEADDGP